ncbi:MAG: hypothetical protein J6N76_07415 [Lachnospiraceae bacterium]|nr:hypothetical protein [Lachnospiraceae bacterium]
MSKLIRNNPDNPRICPICGRKVPRSYIGDKCPNCDAEALYREVKEYIRTHDVTETELAEKYDIPLSQVHQWIHEGFLMYKRDGERL